MHLVYTLRIDNFDRDKGYRNPRFFEKVEKADKVTVEGDYPEIMAAYKKAGIEVVEPVDNDFKKLTVDELKSLLVEKGITFDKSAKKEELINLLEGA